MPAKLIYRDEAGADAAADIPEGAPAFIGRAAECVVRTEDALVSRKNCKISHVGGQFIVEDLGSANGTFVNEERIQKQQLNHGDIIRCGRLLVRYVEVAASPQARARELEERKKALARAKEESAAFKMKLEDKSEVRDPRGRRIERAQEDASRTKTTLEELRNKLAEQERILEERRVSLISLEGATKDLRAEKENSLRELVDATNQRDELKDKLDELKDKLDELKDKLARAESKVEGLEKENGRLAHAMNDVGTKSSDELARLGEELRNLKIAHKKLETDKGRADEALAGAEADRQRLADEKTRLEVERAQLIDEKKTAEAARARSEEARARAESQREQQVAQMAEAAQAAAQAARSAEVSSAAQAACDAEEEEEEDEPQRHQGTPAPAAAVEEEHPARHAENAPPGAPQSFAVGINPVYTLTELASLVGAPDPVFLAAALEGLGEGDLVALGRKIGSGRVVADLVRLYGATWDFLKRATPAQLKALRGVSVAVLANAVHEAVTLEQLAQSTADKLQADADASMAAGKAAQEAMTQGLALREEALVLMREATPSHSAARRDVEIAAGNSVSDAIACGRSLKALARVLDGWLAGDDRALKSRLTTAGLDASFAVDLRTLGTRVIKTCEASLVAPAQGPITEAQLNRSLGVNLTLLARIVRTFDRGADRTPGIPRLEVWWIPRTALGLDARPGAGSRR